MAMKQIATTLEILERQMTQMETQFAWGRRRPEPAPAEPAFRAESEDHVAPQHEEDPELDALRARLAALETRLKS